MTAAEKRHKAYIPVYNGENWWRDIPGYGGKYQANRLGDIRRVYQGGLVRDMTPYRKGNSKQRARLFVKLTVNGKPKEVPVLKIMATTWHGNRDENLVPYHKNGIVTDNHADNIGFTSRSELGRMTGYRSKRRKCVLKVTENGDEVEVYRSAREAARKNNMRYQTVLDRCHNRVKNPFALDGYTYQFEGEAGK